MHMSETPSIVITPATEVSTPPATQPSTETSVTVQPAVPSVTVQPEKETTSVTVQPAKETTSVTVQPAKETKKEEVPKDDGGWLWILILSVLTLVTMGLIVQIVMKLAAKPGENVATAAAVIFVSLCMVILGWLARSKGYKVVAIITPLLSATILSVYNFMV
jgi:hypothetical protein